MYVSIFQLSFIVKKNVQTQIYVLKLIIYLSAIKTIINNHAPVKACINHDDVYCMYALITIHKLPVKPNLIMSFQLRKHIFTLLYFICS